MMVNLPEAESNNKLFVESYLALFVDNKRYSIVICPDSTPFCFGRLSFFRIVQFKSKLRDLMLGSILFVPFPKIHAVQTDRICPETESFNRFYLILKARRLRCLLFADMPHRFYSDRSVSIVHMHVIVVCF